MHAELYVSGRKIKFSFNFGWYRGNNITALKIVVMEALEDYLTIFEIQVGKFEIGIFCDIGGE